MKKYPQIFAAIKVGYLFDMALVEMHPVDGKYKKTIKMCRMRKISEEMAEIIDHPTKSGEQIKVYEKLPVIAYSPELESGVLAYVLMEVLNSAIKDEDFRRDYLRQALFSASKLIEQDRNFEETLAENLSILNEEFKSVQKYREVTYID